MNKTFSLFSSVFFSRSLVSRVLKGSFIAWILGAVYLYANLWFGGFTLETSLQAMMPKGDAHELVQKASDKLFSISARKIIVLFSGEDSDKVHSEALKLKEILSTNTHYALQGDTSVSNEVDDLFSSLYPYRFNVLSDHHRQLLSEQQVSEQQFDQVINDAFKALFEVTSMASIIAVSDDPLRLFETWFQEAYALPTNILFEDGLFYIADKSTDKTANKETRGITHIALIADIVADREDGKLSLDIQNDVNTFISDYASSVASGVTLARSGLAFHTAEAAARAKGDIQWVGIGSTLGIIVLMMLAFYSLNPLLMSLVSIAFGCLSAIAAVHYAFGELHILTLVFGASLVGVTIDYSLHFFVSLYYSPSTSDDEHASPKQALNSILPEISLGLLTTLIGYSCLFQSTLPSLSQIALFSVVGLCGSWLFVVVAYPLVTRTPKRAHSLQSREAVKGLLYIFSAAPTLMWAQLSKAKIVAIFIAMFIFSALALAGKFQWSSDVRALYKPSPLLLENDIKIRGLLSSFAANQFFIILAPSQEELLIKEENVGLQLDELIARDVIQSYDATSRYVPSENRQRQNRQLIENGFYRSEKPRAKTFMSDVGFSQEVINDHYTAFGQSASSLMRLEDWMPVAAPHAKALWIGAINGQYASIIGLKGVSDAAPLSLLAAEAADVMFVDNVEAMASNLNRQTLESFRLLVLAYACIALLILLRYRAMSSLVIVIIPLTASTISLAIFSIAAIEISLFHVFGLFLVLGLGMDYGIFLSKKTSHNNAKLLAITLSALTSCLSFGLLSLSSTPMISAFGSTVLLGSVLNLICVPVVARLNAD